MNFERFIALRLSSRTLSGYTRPLIRIAISGVALSIAVMLLSIAIVTGFQNKIRDKVFGFSGHIQISRFDANESYESKPISLDQNIYKDQSAVDGISHVQPYATKAGIIKTGEQIEGVVLKGVGADYDWSSFSGRLIKGRRPLITDTSRSNDVMISQKLASRLLLDTGDAVRMYFVSEGSSVLRGRKFDVCGIYGTGMEEFDRAFVLGDLKHVQRLNNWETDQVSGFEVLTTNTDHLDEISDDLRGFISYDLDARPVSYLYPQIFDWLKLQDMNVLIILVLMAFVSAVTMISALLIIILERIHLIGVLKSLGAANASIRKIFIYQALRITLSGMIIGNIFGFTLAWLQQQYGIFRLSEESYYLSAVPIQLEWLPVLLLNLATLVLCITAMLLPSMLVSRIQVVKVITMR